MSTPRVGSAPYQRCALVEPLVWNAFPRNARCCKKTFIRPALIVGVGCATLVSWAPCADEGSRQHLPIHELAFSLTNHRKPLPTAFNRFQQNPITSTCCGWLPSWSARLYEPRALSEYWRRGQAIVTPGRSKSKLKGGYTALSATTQKAEMASSGEVGFIGIGIMGRGMALNLLKGGRTLLVWNRDTKKAEDLAKEHPGKVTVCASAAEVVQRSTLIYSMLSTLEASEAVFPSVLEALTEGKMIVDCATLTPERMAFMAGAATAKKAKFLEAPVSGSKGPAEQGQLIFLTAGDEDVKAASESDLSHMGKATFHFGPAVGGGSRMKMVVNMIMGIQLNAYAEGLALAEAFGLKGEDLHEILKLGAMNSPMIQLKGPAMMKREYPAAFPLKHAQKDMRFALQMGDEAGLALPIAAASNEQYKKARYMGWGDSDFAAVAEASRLEGNTNGKT